MTKDRKEESEIRHKTHRATLRATLTPLAAGPPPPPPPRKTPPQALPLCLPPGYGTLWSSGRGRLKRGTSVAVRSSLAGVLARSLPPALRLNCTFDALVVPPWYRVLGNGE